MKNVILVFCLLILFVPLANAQEEITVSSIHVWVAVEGSKGPLTEKDFEIFEDGKKMTSTCFESSNRATVNGQVEGTSQIFRRKAIAIFFDQLNTAKPEFALIRAKVEEFLNDIDGKSRIMLAAFPPFERLVSFTTDVNEIRNALESLNVNHERDFTITKRRSQIELFLEAERIEQALNLALEFQQLEIQEIQIYLDSLKDLASYLSNESDANEHTVVMLISGGINLRPGQQYLDMLRKYTDIGQNLSLNQSGNSGFDVRNALQKTIGRLNRDNLTIYTISTHGQINVIDTSRDVPLSIGQQKAYREDYQNSLYQIATETGGLAFENSLNFKHGFDAILNDLSQQYLLCYQAPEHDDDDDDEYHEIKVKSKVKGIKLRHREGYVD
jgi:VWFA-related protein